MKKIKCAVTAETLQILLSLGKIYLRDKKDTKLRFDKVYNVFALADKQYGIVVRNSFIDDRCKMVTLEEMIQAIITYKPSFTPVAIELGSEYTVIVSRDKITVGCQTVSFEKFDEIAKAVEAARNFVD